MSSTVSASELDQVEVDAPVEIFTLEREFENQDQFDLFLAEEEEST